MKKTVKERSKFWYGKGGEIPGLYCMLLDMQAMERQHKRHVESLNADIRMLEKMVTALQETK